MAMDMVPLMKVIHLQLPHIHDSGCTSSCHIHCRHGRSPGCSCQEKAKMQAFSKQMANMQQLHVPSQSWTS